MINEEVRYWIQEQAPNGGWVDSVGYNPDAKREDVLLHLATWREFHVGRKFRAIQRHDVVIEEGGAK